MRREDTIAFASLYDPQPFHIDDAAAAANPVFGRLSASGWHTAVMAQMLVAELMRKAGLRGLAGGAVQEIRWLKPVFPPETLDIDLKIVEVRPSKSRPERGILKMKTIVYDAHRKPTAEIVITGIFLREDGAT